MKVALDATPLSVPTGGVARYTAELGRSLAANFPEDEFWLLSDQKYAHPAPEFANLKSGPGPVSVLERRWWLWGLQGAISRHGIAVFHGTDFSVPYLPLRPSVMTLHDLSPWLDPAWHADAGRVRLRTPLLLRLGRATMIVTPSQAVRQGAIERFGIHPDRIAAIPHAAAGHFRPVEKNPSETPYILYVGTLEPRKNLDVLIEAWREVRKKYPIDLVLAGRRRRDFREPPAEHGLRLLGAVEDDALPALYSNALACAYPSLYEGFGLPVLEAMQCGALVLTSLDPAVSEVAADAAVRLEPRDVRAWADSADAGAHRSPMGRRDARQSARPRCAFFLGSHGARNSRSLRRSGAAISPPMTSGSRVLVLSPEAPYPPIGGGALRTASLIEYFARSHEVDLILFRQPDHPDPAALVPLHVHGRRLVLELPRHGTDAASKSVRNAVRAFRGTPPLVDRFSGFASPIARFLQGARYDIGVIEHFWCAPYVRQLRAACDEIWLDLHNVESVLQRREALAAGPLAALGFRRFAESYRRLERELLPRFDVLLAASAHDASLLGPVAPGCRIAIFPNTIPERKAPDRVEEHAVVFSGNLAYRPNTEAVRYFAGKIWPTLRQRWPGLQWRIVGRNPEAIKRFVDPKDYIQCVGPVEDAVLELSHAKAVVVPVLAGSGTRVKILEAWAAGAPVVSTTLGAEGLPVAPGEHLLIADDPLEFAETVSQLLASKPLRRRIGAAGRLLYEQNFTWQAGWRALDSALFRDPSSENTAAKPYTGI